VRVNLIVVAHDNQPSKRFIPDFSSLNRTIEQSRNLQAKNEASIRHALEEIAQAKELEAQEERESEQARVQREIEGLQHTGALVEQQGQILEAQRELLLEQMRQANEGRADRRIQYAILTFTASALVAGIAFGVYSITESKTWLWATLLLTSLVVAGVAWMVVPGRRIEGAPTDPGAAD